MDFFIADNSLFIRIVNIIGFLFLAYLCYFYIVVLPKQHKEIVNFLKEKKHLSDVEVEFLESLSRFNNIWDNFNRPFRGVRFQDDAFIMDLMVLVKDVRDRYAIISAKREAIDNFKIGNE
ncbi:hypothetical protein [uncultured Campylobacter sp.]|uniref:hypothetical protein n=2 Tax=uncultured Campylobacter sp. TaxID=218934 RepID=UPI0026232CAB|nr:hypothetical protein [uncultured Campylobacter sp.]